MKRIKEFELKETEMEILNTSYTADTVTLEQQILSYQEDISLYQQDISSYQQSNADLKALRDAQALDLNQLQCQVNF